MMQKDEIIMALKLHKEFGGRCIVCPYWNSKKCSQDLCADVLSLLSGIEEENKTILDDGTKPLKSTDQQREFAGEIGLLIPDYRCGSCGFMLIGHPKYCQECGEKVKWDD